MSRAGATAGSAGNCLRGYSARMSDRPTIDVAVIMRRVYLDNRWQPWRWELVDVVPAQAAFGSGARLLREDATEQRWLFPGFQAALFRDDSEGYHLNLSSPAPCWFVHWRLDEAPGDDGHALARPVDVSLSYHDAGRWLDAQENVDQVPAPEEVRAWAQAFVDEHYVAEPKRRRRPDSFRPLTDRFGNPASVSTDKDRRGGGAGQPPGHAPAAAPGGRHGG